MSMPRTPPCGPGGSPELAAVRRRGPSVDKTAQTQRQITEAALATFLAQGLSRTTMAQIAERAGVAKGTIYSYYPSKEALLRGVVEHALSQSAVYQPLQRRPAETLQALLRRSLLPTMRAIECSDRGRLAQWILTEAKQHPELARLYKELAFDPWQRHVQGLLQMACAEGELAADRVEDGARLMASPFWMAMVHNGLLSSDPQEHVAIEPLMDRLIALLFTPDATTPPDRAGPHPVALRKTL